MLQRLLAAGICAAAVMTSLDVLAQPAPMPYRIETHVPSGARTIIQPRTAPEATSGLTFELRQAAPPAGPFVTVETIERKEAEWLRLQFGTYNLGQNSSVVIRSLEDGAEQRFTAEQLKEWNGATAAFNGSAVQVILQVAPNESGIFYNIDQVIIGEPRTARRAPERRSELGGRVVAETESICGVDDRKPSNDKRIGRIMPVGCTGWIIPSGIHLTAGHCVGASMQLLQFNVPASGSDGKTKNPLPEHQYLIKSGQIVFNDDGKGQEGDDWAIFSVTKNTQTGKYPIQAQGGAVSLSQDMNVKQVRVTGYGLDDGVDNQVQQTHSAEFGGVKENQPNDVKILHKVDTRGGNSGSPILALNDDGSEKGVAIGIHTNAGCENEGNSGTGLTHQKLWQSIKDFKDKPKL